MVALQTHRTTAAGRHDAARFSPRDEDAGRQLWKRKGSLSPPAGKVDTPRPSWWRVVNLEEGDEARAPRAAPVSQPGHSLWSMMCFSLGAQHTPRAFSFPPAGLFVDCWIFLSKMEMTTGEDRGGA